MCIDEREINREDLINYVLNLNDEQINKIITQFQQLIEVAGK